MTLEIKTVYPNTPMERFKYFKMESETLLEEVTKQHKLNSPMHLRCQLLSQAEWQLNLLSVSNNIPTISSYTYLYGAHNYNAHPFALLGTALEMHVKPSRRTTLCAAHSLTGCYIGISCEHYRCTKVWINDTKSIRIGNTVFIKHKYLTMSTVATDNALMKAAADLTIALDSNIPKSTFNQENLQTFMDIFTENAKSYQEEETSRRKLQD